MGLSEQCLSSFCKGETEETEQRRAQNIREQFAKHEQSLKGMFKGRSLEFKEKREIKPGGIYMRMEGQKERRKSLYNCRITLLSALKNSRRGIVCQEVIKGFQVLDFRTWQPHVMF